MATHKSALKRMRQSEKARLRNKARSSRMKTFIKRVRAALEAKDVAAARAALAAAIPEIDKAAARGAIKKENASRKISRLSRAVSQLAAGNK